MPRKIVKFVHDSATNCDKRNTVMPCTFYNVLEAPYTFYVPIDFIFYLIVFFLGLTSVPCVRII